MQPHLQNAVGIALHVQLVVAGKISGLHALVSSGRLPAA
jgi:hypothetical protein